MKLARNQAGRLFSVTAIIAICLLFLSCASFSFAASKSCQVPKDFFGVSPDRSPLEKEDFDLLDDFNAAWIRTTIWWSSVEPEQGEWNFDRWDAYLEKAEAAQKKVVFILGFDNGWLFKNNKEHRKLSDEGIPYFLNYVEQVVSRYRTRVVYEIWNEPNVIFWKGSDAQFFKVAAASVNKARETEPKAIILIGSTFRVSKSFTQGLYNVGALGNADGFSVHPYGLTPKSTIKLYTKLKKILNEFDFYKPIWITEVGYLTGPYPFFTTNHYAEDIVKTLSGLAARSGEIRNIIWYELMNNDNEGEEENPLNPLRYMGLIYPNKKQKDGAEAFMLTAGHIAGATYNPRLPLREGINKKITSLYFKKDDGSGVLILWNDGKGQASLQLAIPGAKNITRHNIHNREASSLQEKLVLEISSEPVFITWEGGDSPPLLEQKPLSEQAQQ